MTRPISVLALLAGTFSLVKGRGGDPSDERMQARDAAVVTETQIVTVTQSGSTRRKRPHHHHHHQRPKTKYITVTSWATTTVPAGVSTSVSALAQWQPSTTAWTATSSTTHWESTWLAAAASSTSSTSNWQTSWLASSTTSSVGAAIASSSTSSSTSSSAVSTTTGTATGGGSVSVCNGCTYPMTKNPFPSFSAANAFTVSVYAGTSNDLFTVGSCGLKAPGNMNKYPTYDASLLPLAMPDTAMDVGGTGYANFLCGQIITISIDGSDGLTKGTYQAVIASRNVPNPGQKAPSLDLSAELWAQMGGVAGNGCHYATWKVNS